MPPPAPISRKPPTTGRVKLAPLPSFGEAEFKRELYVAINNTGVVRVWRQQAGQARGRTGSRVYLAPVGAADLCGVARPSGLHVEVETKAAAGRVSPEQTAWAETTRADGGVYYLAQPQRGETLATSVRRCVQELLALVAEATRETCRYV